MRVAVSGSHGTGKTTLIGRFLQRCPDFAHEPEAYETIGDDVDLTDAGVPTPDGLRSLLEYTIAALEGRAAGTRVVFERSPADYLAYAAASRGAWRSHEIQEFIATWAPLVRASMRQLDLVAYLPLSAAGAGPRRGENEGFRRRVDVSLRRILLDDEYGIFAEGRTARVIALPSAPDAQLAALVHHTAQD
jgi:hypothetical protein